MRKLLLVTATFLLHICLHSQSNTIGDATKLMNAYWAEPTAENYNKAEVAISEIWENDNAQTDAISLFLKSQILTAQLTNEEIDKPDDYAAFLDEIVDTYSTALIYDKNNKNRYHILKNLFAVKDALTTEGAIYYNDKDYENAYKCYDAASRMNEVEIKFPRIARPDTSTIYSSGVMANLAGKDELAIKYFERVVELQYYRQDAYDQLIALYKKNKFDVKAKKMEIKKNQAFPPEQND
jgi:tetratricopeptide (TPR) repeat protein